MICNAVIMRKCCHIGVRYQCITMSQYFRLLYYENLQKTGHTEVILRFSIKFHPILCYTVEQEIFAFI